MTDRRRNGLILLLVLGLIAASAVVIATKPTKLGLDLKGGVELVYQGEPTPQVPNVTEDALNRSVDIIRQRVDQLGVGEPEIQRSGGNQIVVDLPAVQNIERARNQVGTAAQLYFYDWETNLIAPDGRTVASELAAQNPQAEALSQSAGNAAQGQTIYDAVRLASRQPERAGGSRRGPAYYAFTRDHTYLAGPEISRTDLLSAIGRSTFPAGTQILTVPQGTVVLQAVDSNSESPVRPQDPAARFFVLRDNVALTGNDLKNPSQGFDQSNQPDVQFNFSSKGKKQFQQVTKQIAQRGQNLALPGVQPTAAFQHFAVSLDGKLVSVPFIDFQQNPSGIDASNGATIQGSFTISSAQDLANLLKLGALPINLKLISQSQVSATLGKQALHQGLIAGLVGLGLVALFLLTFYRILGLIAVGALVVYGVYFFALIRLIPVTLTLPGIAGLILTIGVAADANIVIFERVKEEVRAGRAVPAAIAAGYRRGLSAIVDANVVTVMVAFILFILATSSVKGFAFTLGLGTLVSLFTAVMATQAILSTMGRSRLLARPSALGAHVAGRRWRFDFMGKSRYFFSLSGLILVIGALAIGGKGINFGIDFTSGTQVTTNLVHPASENQVRSVLATLGAPDAKIQRVTNKDLGPHVYQIETKTLQPARVTELRSRLDARFGGTTSFSSSSVGPTFGQSVANDAIIAIIASLIVISAYIALRFQWKFAVPVLIALMHDLLITAGVYALTGREVTTSTVAALLTILGYSLYDTIIVFDRVRENTPRMPRAAFSQIVNRSMSEVLTRSLATSLTTLLPIVSLLIIGGDTLKDFAFALMIGVISGAYSSIFIASPVLTHWKERESVYVARRKRIESENGGAVPAYAVATIGGEPIDVEPSRRARRRRRGLSDPDPNEISAEEFEELKRGLEVDHDLAVPSPGGRSRPGGRRTTPNGRGQTATAPRRRAAPQRQPEPEPEPETPSEPAPPALGPDGRAPDVAENDGIAPTQRPRPSGRRNRRGGRR